MSTDNSSFELLVVIGGTIVYFLMIKIWAIVESLEFKVAEIIRIIKVNAERLGGR